jgi:hypothetical protein
MRLSRGCPYPGYAMEDCLRQGLDQSGFRTRSYSPTDPTICSPSLRWCPATMRKWVGLEPRPPFGELDLDASVAGFNGAFAQERHVRPVVDVGSTASWRRSFTSAVNAKTNTSYERQTRDRAARHRPRAR